MLERKNERIEFISSIDDPKMSLFDLSESGVGCYYSKAREKNSFILVKINDLSLRARVIYCTKRKDDYRLGLQFWNILPEKQEKLNEIVNQYSKGVPVSCRIEENENRDKKDKKVEKSKKSKK
ncbi:MAG: PilZ domain-containing protein [Chitinispirillia bacterium]|jgi:hypothetical protein